MLASGLRRWLWVEAGVSLALVVAVAALWSQAGSDGPVSSPIEFVYDPAAVIASPADLPAREATPPTVRLAFAGDIMQHAGQAGDDFDASYAQIADFLRGFDLLIGNLEFPVDPEQPVGPPNRSVRFNGSPQHLDALAGAGFDLLSTANNHSFDAGWQGFLSTIDELERRGLQPIGTAPTLDELQAVLRDVGGITVAIQAYSFQLNEYPTPDGEVDRPPRELPLYELNFMEWADEYRDEGLALFREHATAARADGADFVIAFVHWGEEWHFQPTADQRRAARDMIDAGFDLIVGTHSHVLNGAEIYDGRLIAYSLGNFISDFGPLETRTGAVLAVDLAKLDSGEVAVVDFRYHPVLVAGENHAVALVREGDPGDAGEAWALAQRVVGEAIAGGRRTPSGAGARD